MYVVSSVLLFDSLYSGYFLKTKKDDKSENSESLEISVRMEEHLGGSAGRHPLLLKMNCPEGYV